MPEDNEASTPANIDPNMLELIERRLSERIGDRAEKSLIKRFTWIGAILLTVLGYFGYDLIQSTRTAAEKAAVETANQIIQREVTPVAEEAHAKLTEATNQLEQNKGRLELIDGILARNQLRVEAASGRASETAERVKSTLGELNSQVDELKRRIEETSKAGEDQLKALRDSFKDAGTLQDLNANLAALATQVVALDGLVQALASKLQIGPLTSTGKETVQTIIKATQSREEQYQERGRKLVFFQFAILPRDQAKAIAAALRDHGYVVPGEDREEAATNLREVRYFYNEDKIPAEQLAAQAGAVLTELGYGQVNVKAESFTAYKGRKPRLGVLELWLGIKPL